MIKQNFPSASVSCHIQIQTSLCGMQHRITEQFCSCMDKCYFSPLKWFISSTLISNTNPPSYVPTTNLLCELNPNPKSDVVGNTNLWMKTVQQPIRTQNLDRMLLTLREKTMQFPAGSFSQVSWLSKIKISSLETYMIFSYNYIAYFFPGKYVFGFLFFFFCKVCFSKKLSHNQSNDFKN